MHTDQVGGRRSVIVCSLTDEISSIRIKLTRTSLTNQVDP